MSQQQPRWAVAFSYPGQEAKAVGNASRAGIECFFPRIKVRRFYRGKRRYFYEPLFPRYFFVQLLINQWHLLFNTVGVGGVIMNGEKPAPLPVNVVDEIKSRCDTSGVYVPYRFRFHPGQKVRVERGVLQGHLGIYRGMRSEDRADVLIQMLGATVHASFLEGDLVAA